MNFNLQKAVSIYNTMDDILIEGKSSFLSDSKPITKHKICDLINELNNEAVLCEEKFFRKEDFIKSLKIDDIEVIGIKKNYYYRNLYIDSKKICELSTPSYFGKRTETVYDENVRKATEITADRMKIKYATENIFSDKFKNIVPVGKKFDFKLYKMQIYKEGGMFKKHKDTIHAPNHYATLIVFLPEFYDGGELCLYNDGKILKEVKQTCTGYCDMVIFLTDVEHEVLPVKSGTRIVLQYDVYLLDDDSDEDDKDEDEDEDDEYDETEPIYNKPNKQILTKELTRCSENLIIEEIDKFIDEHPNDEICFLLTRQYSLASISTEFLKAGDKTLYDILKEKYMVDVGYVVNKFGSDYSNEYDIDKKKVLKVMNYSDIQNFITYYQNGIKEDKKSDSDTFIFITGAEFTNTNAKDYIEYTGNEAAPSEYTYVSLALCIKRK